MKEKLDLSINSDKCENAIDPTWNDLRYEKEIITNFFCSNPYENTNNFFNSNVVDVISLADAEQKNTKLDYVNNNNKTKTEKQISATINTSKKSLDKYFQIKTNISSPKKELDKNLKEYISYQITSDIDESDISKSIHFIKKNNITKYCVRRRYNDFKSLRKFLKFDYPNRIIPPLSEKLNLFNKNNDFDNEFIRNRVESLNTFIRFIAEHPALSCLLIFHVFISSTKEWTNLLDLKTTCDEISKNKNNFFFKSLNLLNIFDEKFLIEKITDLLNQNNTYHSDDETLDVINNLKKMRLNFKKINQIIVKLNQKSFIIGVNYNELLLSIINLLNNENEFNIFNSNSKNDQTNSFNPSKYYGLFSDFLDFFLKSWLTLKKVNDENFLNIITDHFEYIQTLIDFIVVYMNKKKITHNKELNVFINDLEVKNQSSKNSVIINSEKSFKNEILNLNNKLSNVKNNLIQTNTVINDLNHLETNSTSTNNFKNSIIFEEMLFWDKFNLNNLKNGMIKLCDNEITFYDNLIEKCDNIMLDLGRDRENF